jgi:hypothetical protein
VCFGKIALDAFVIKVKINLVIIGFVDTFCTTFAKVDASGEISGGKFGRVNVGEMGHFFFSKIHIKSTIHLINKEIVLFFRVINFLSTVKDSSGSV